MRRRLSSTDHNQKEIVGALRAVGASVIDTSYIGNGFPDLVVGFRGVVHLLEVKNEATYYGRSGFNKNQKAWRDDWRGSPPVIVRTINEALQAIGAVE